ncbi:MAG: hypothetical protein Barrevirus16_4 [Barrevirus sp.]|uniref:Zinc-ribbon domain-containing protein n=1 Tax=Barrevirus sp. TaxID=2487763 RepID=A0A3G4ZQJ1_9VIRU|nr:MAG: hypothetical protein Barrevirus16_4 [Barrevirus sp.]
MTNDLKKGLWCSHEECKVSNDYFNLCLCTTSDTFDSYKDNYYFLMIRDYSRYNDQLTEWEQYSIIDNSIILELREKYNNSISLISSFMNRENPISLKFSESKMFNIKYAKYSLETAIEIANDNGFKCLSTVYVGPREKLQFECEDGHIFYRTMYDLVANRFCDQDEKDHYYSLQDIQDFVSVKKGKILSTEFTVVMNVYKWQCSKGHTWHAVAHNILYNNAWCSICSIYGKRWTIEDMKKIALKRGGKCLSNIYVNITSPLTWKCREGHEWDTNPINILDGCWCRDCTTNVSYGEKLTGQILDIMFDTTFKKVRPDWLINSVTGFPMEIDLYNEDLELGVEYQGKQHYEFIKLWQKTEDNFKKQQARDIEKKELCVKRNITLIAVPYTLKFYEIQEFIISECEKNNIEVPNKETIDVNELNIY